MAMVSLPRSWQDLGKATKELAMDLGKGTMASNTGLELEWTTKIPVSVNDFHIPNSTAPKLSLNDYLPHIRSIYVKKVLLPMQLR